MKKILLIVVFLISIGVFCRVKAETFVEGNYLPGEYISKRKDGAIHYMTVQFLKSSDGSIVYCLEPYTKFIEGQSYTSFTGDISGYNDLSESQKRKISLIIYYGFGYGERKNNKWYAITQFLIWDTVTNGDGTIYFTDKLNGGKIEKYTSEISELLNDVNNHDVKPKSIYDRTVNYNDGLVISDIDKDNYEIVKSSYKYTFDNNVSISNIKENGSIEIRRLSNYYQNKVTIFDSTRSQDLIKPGNVNNPIYKMNVNVLKGNITLDIKKDDSVYTIESDFSNTCYDVLFNGKVIDSVCTNKDEMVYKTVDLTYGDYEIVQKSVGLGFKQDTKKYKVSVNSSNPKPEVNLYNLLIRNNIEIKKYACKDQICNPESAAKFSIINSKGNLVNNIVTDKDGYTKIELGYGTYKIKQISGLYEYTNADEYSEKIVDEEGKHFSELFNYYILEQEEDVVEPEEKPKEEPIEKPKEVKIEIKKEQINSESTNNKTKELVVKEDLETVEEEAPDTGVDGGFISKLVFIITQIIFSIVNSIAKKV